MLAQLLQEPAAGGPDAADRDAQPRADLGVGQGRVFEQQGDQLLTGGRQGRERLAQRGVALGRQQFLVGRRGPLVGQELGVQHVPGRRPPLPGVREPKAFPPGHGHQPARERGRIPELAQLAGQLQPHVLADVVGVGAVQPVLAADGPEQRGEPHHQCVPGEIVVPGGAGHEVSERHRVSARAHRCLKDLRGLRGLRGPLGRPAGAAPDRGIHPRHRRFSRVWPGQARRCLRCHDHCLLRAIRNVFLAGCGVSVASTFASERSRPPYVSGHRKGTGWVTGGTVRAP